MPGYFTKDTKALFIGRNPGQLYERKSGWSDNKYATLNEYGLFQIAYAKGLMEAPLGKFISKLVDGTSVQWGLTNICKCRTPDDSPLSVEEIENCREYLTKQIILTDPQLIVTFGVQAWAWFSPTPLAQMMSEDIQMRVECMHVQPSSREYIIFPMYHPASLKYSAKNTFNYAKKQFNELIRTWCV